MTRVEIDERPVGYWRTWKADSGMVVGGFDSELLELAPDQRLVFRWGFIGPQRRQGPSFDTPLDGHAPRRPAGQQDEVAERQRTPWLDQLDRDVGLGAQRVEIVEVRDARQARHRDPEPSCASG